MKLTPEEAKATIAAGHPPAHGEVCRAGARRGAGLMHEPYRSLLVCADCSAAYHVIDSPGTRPYAEDCDCRCHAFETAGGLAIVTTVGHVNGPAPADGRRTVYIGRAVPRKGIKASPWGNPYVVGRDGTREACVQAFRLWVRWSTNPAAAWMRDHVHELAGAHLVCWCVTEKHPDAPCHGRVLAEMADAAAAAKRGEAGE